MSDKCKLILMGVGAKACLHIKDWTVLVPVSLIARLIYGTILK